MPHAATAKLALFGGEKAVREHPGDLFTWPIITKEDEEAALEVLRRGAMSGTDVTLKFEKDFAEWVGLPHTLAFSSGTASVLGAMYGCGVGVGDEVIAPSVTYWATCLQVYALGATVVFADIDPVTWCIDPRDIERRITPRTKAIIVVHYLGHPADMDEIMEIARRHNVKVIEDVSHAHGALYKGRLTGTIGDVAAFSLMSGKSLAVGEGGMLATADRSIYERALTLGHYERFTPDAVSDETLKRYAGLPLGGYKFRMHQVSSAVGRVQLKYYNERMAEIDKAMNYFWDLLEGVPGIRPHRPPKGSGTTMGGWYAARGQYVPEELGGLSVSRFCEAVRAEGVETCTPGCNLPLHLHPVFTEADVYGHGRPTRIANSERDVRQYKGDLPVSEAFPSRAFAIPWFKHFRKEQIEMYAEAYRKAALRYEELLKDDPGNPPLLGKWNTSSVVSPSR